MVFKFPLQQQEQVFLIKKGSLNMHHLRLFGTFQDVSLTLLEN